MAVAEATNGYIPQSTRRPLAGMPPSNVCAAAQSWLRSSFPDEYTDLPHQERARRNLADEAEEPPFRHVHEQSDLLVERHSAEYEFIRAELRPHEKIAGFLPESLTNSPQRAEIKHRILRALADGTWG